MSKDRLSNNLGGEQIMSKLNEETATTTAAPLYDSAASFVELATHEPHADSAQIESSEPPSLTGNDGNDGSTGSAQSLEGLYHYGKYMYGVVTSGEHVETRGWIERDMLSPDSERVIVDIMRYLGNGRFRKANFVLKDESGIFDVSAPVDIRQSYTYAFESHILRFRNTLSILTLQPSARYFNEINNYKLNSVILKSGAWI